MELGRKLSDISLSLSLIHTDRKTHRHTLHMLAHPKLRLSESRATELQAELLGPCQRVFTEKATIQYMLPGAPVAVIGKGGSSQEENKNHKKKKSLNAFNTQWPI